MTQTHINIAMLAHVDAGKTTLSEALLYKSGSIRKAGRVDNKDAFLDTNEMERNRGITIFSKQAVFSYGGCEFTLLDTPGHVDFSAEMERTLQVLDYAVLIISGADGVQGHTRTLWRLLARYNIPAFIFVNKMDQQGTDHDKLLAQIKDTLGSACVDFSKNTDGTYLDEDFYENVAVCNEKVLETYLEGGSIGEEDIRQMIQKRELFPCFFGSALKMDGIDELLAALSEYTKIPDYPEKFGATVFKITRDAGGSRLTHLKVTGGTLKARNLLTGYKQNKEDDIWEEKVNQIRLYSGERYECVDRVEAGEVCVILGLSRSYAGMTLGDCAREEHAIIEPVLSYEVIPPEGCAPHVLLSYMRQLEEEDPTLRVTWQERARQVHVHLMGPVQTEVLQQQLKKRYGILVTFGAGKVRYKETIRGAVEGVGHFEPLRHYAEAHILIEELPQGSGMEYAMDCPPDVLDLNWQRLIYTHLAERTHRGVLTGSPLTDVRLTVVSGKAHKKHTEGGDFRQATYRAVRQGLRKAQSVLLEPYYRVRIEMPQQALGRVMTDMSRMYGKFDAPILENETAVLQGIAPVALMRDYGAVLAQVTGGLGQMTLALEGYFPCHNQDEVVAEIAYDPDKDLRNTCDSVFCGHGAGYLVPWYEVEDKMHMPMASYLYEKKQEASMDQVIAAAKARAEAMRQGQPQGYDGYGGLESDLEEIFVREFGEIKRRLPGAEKRVIDADKKDRMQEAREAYQKAHARDKKVAIRKKYLLVDGYNVIFAWKELDEIAKTSIDGARGRLLDIMCNYQGHVGQEVIVVFDAYRVRGHVEEVVDYHNIHVVYTREAETADAYIERTTHDMADKYEVTVATSDRREQMIVIGEGARRFSARDLEKEVERVNREAMEAFKPLE